MAEEKESQFELYSLGIVVEDKQYGSDQIVVQPIEKLPTIYGEIAATKENKTTFENAKGSQEVVKTTSRNTIVASWLAEGDSNRMSAPDVRKSETVRLFRFGDTDKFYWNTIFREPNLRRQEIVIHAYGNIKNGIQPFDLNSSYWLKADTVNKIMQLHTANNDGEACTYDILIDTSLGTLTVKDSLGNDFTFNSRYGDLTINTTQTVNVKTETATVNVSKCVVNASDSIDLNTPVVNISKNLNVGGSIDIKDGITDSDGKFTVKNGNLHVTGNVVADKDVRGEKIYGYLVEDKY